MKVLYLCCLTFLLANAAFAQQNITVCGAPATATMRFAQLASDKDFRDVHDIPTAYTHQNALGKDITFKTTDGQDGTAYFVPAKTKSDKYLLVIHEWWGLNDYIKKESDRLSGELDNVNVLALDLYDGKVATTREEAAQYIQSTKEERAKAIIKGAIEYAGDQAKIGTIGWCFGGGWSLQATMLAGKQAVGCVMFYGMPVQEQSEIQKIDADVLAIFAKQDARITPEVAHKFEDQMQEAGKNITVKIFDAGHGFANPSSESYHQSAAQKANKLALAFLKKHL